MQENKENSSKFKSRIPVLIKRANSLNTKDREIKTLRDPLKTINGQCLLQGSAGPSRAITEEKDEALFQVFKDQKDAGSSTAADKEILSAPFDSPPVFSTEKKVKNSLKRAHTKGLQGLAPRVSKARRRLNLTSEKAELADPRSCVDELTQDYVNDILTYTLSRETKAPGPFVNPINPTVRSCIVNWIIKVNARRGSPSVLQTTCWYLDRYLSTTHVPVVELQQTAAACYWLATKVHGRPITCKRLMRCASNAFTSKILIATELRVLSTLNYQVGSTVPDDFVPYLCWWCEGADCEELQSAATFLCTCGQLVEPFLGQEYASVVGAAAVKCALVLLQKQQRTRRLEDCPVYQAAARKACNLAATQTLLLNCVRTMSAAGYDYKALVDLYSTPPLHTSSRIITAVHAKSLNWF